MHLARWKHACLRRRSPDSRRPKLDSPKKYTPEQMIPTKNQLFCAYCSGGRGGKMKQSNMHLDRWAQPCDATPDLCAAHHGEMRRDARWESEGTKRPFADRTWASESKESTELTRYLGSLYLPSSPPVLFLKAITHHIRRHRGRRGARLRPKSHCHQQQPCQAHNKR